MARNLYHVPVMLRRKLLLVLGSLVLLTLVAAVSSILVLHGVLADLVASDDMATAIAKFRMAGLLVGIVFLVLLNASIVIVLRSATMVLKPVDALVDASRRLAREEFDHRIALDTDDEFGELARAYNGMARQLQSQERRKIETLRQVARTLSHELNNAMAVIELQLTMMDRRRGDAETRAAALHQCREMLARMHGTIEALGRVRRIVLTDYVSGVKMLDLQRSIGPVAGGSSPTAAAPQSTPA